MDLFKKIKNKLGMLALFGLLFQLTMPVYQTYVFANENGIGQTEHQIDDENNEAPKDKNQADEGFIAGAPEFPEEMEEEKNKEQTEQLEDIKDENDLTDGKEENTEDIGSVSTESVPEDLTIEPEVKRETKEITKNIITGMRLKYKDGTVYEEGDFIEIDEDLRLELDWALLNGHGYMSGDYFEFKLPKQLTVYNPLDGSLDDYGTYTVDMEGNAKFTFNENIEAQSDIKGTFWFETELNQKEITTTEETIELVVNGEVVQKIVVNVKPTGGQAISKNGQPVDGNFNTEEVEWTVVINATRDSLKNAIINDPILAGQELILDSLVLKEVEVNSKGEVTKELDDAGFKNNSTVENLNIELGNTNKAYKLTFKTKLLEKDFKEGTTSYENTAVLKSDGKDDAQAGGSVSVSRPKSMEKISSTFDKDDRSIEWTVNANFTEQNLKKDDVITDEFTFTVGEDEVNDVFEIKSENISIVQVDKFDDKGKATETSNAKDLFHITIEGNKVTYKLKEASNKAFILKYKTELKDGAYIHKDGVITNNVDLNGKTITGSQGVIQQVGKKTNAGINYKDKTIDWQITVNADEQDLRKFVLTDNFAGTGQKLVADSIEITPDNTGATITPNVDSEGFEINFGNITDTYTIKYQTEFVYDFEGTKTPNFKNGVKITYETSDDSKYELGFGNEIEPNEATKNNGAKNGTVNQETKEITWKIDINYNQLKLTNAKVTDAIPDNQALIDDSVKIYETSIASKGGITVGHDVTDQFTVEASENQVNIDFGKIDKSYRIEFKTKDKDGIYNVDEVYENAAQFIPREDEKHNLTGNVTLPNQGQFIGKTGTHNKEDWTIDWKIDVNKSLSTTADFTVTDDLGEGQILLKDTIKVTKAGVTDELEEGEGKDYKLTVDGNEFTIYFPGKITEAFVITYSSYILAEEDVNITNKAEITSNDRIVGTTEKTETINVRISAGGGTGEGTTGGLVLEKFEADSKRALKDVAFNLVKTIGNKEIVVRKGTTDTEGKLEWNGLQYGDYELKEIIPEGYLGEEERTVTLSLEDPKGIKTLPIENTRKTGYAKIVKVDAHTGEALKGAEFILTNQTTEQEYTFKTDKDGVILEKVPFGEYTVKEITAPDGYRITTDIENITVKIDKTATVEVENVAYVDIAVQKTWYVDEGKKLPESITVNLLRNGQVTNQSIILSAANNWKDNFKNLDKYTKANKEIEYDIEEVAVDGYIVEKDGYNLINIQSTDVSGEKIWIDDNNPERPDSITVQLLANGEKVVGKTTKVTKASNWEYAFNNIPKYDVSGNEIMYDVVEVGVPDNYESTVKDLNITNLRKATISISGEKMWKDEGPTDRPAEIKVNLTRKVEKEIDNDFNETLTVRPNSKGEWKYTFHELDQFDEHGVEYTYIVKEDEVPDTYKSTVDGYDITNVRVGKTEVSGTKRWKDDKVDDRPESITVNLLRNNVVVQSTDVTADDNWEYSFTELDKYDEDGKYYNYTVKEEQVPGYAPEITGDDITNTRSEKTNFEITKGWLDDNSKNRPESIIVYVYQSDELFDTVEITASEKWTHSLTNLEAYDKEGQPYTYTIKEKLLTAKDSIDQYKSTVNGFNITNLRVGETEVSGEKIWNEVDKQYRPDSIKINLLANGEKFKNVEISERNNWKYAFKGLAKYDDQGKEINYTIEEVEIPAGYQSAIDGHNVINTQIKTEIAGQKMWIDDNNPERPASIKIHLLANGEKTNHSLEVSGKTDWRYRFTDIPKYDKAGEEIEYSVTEEAIKGYKTLIDGFTITNLRIGKIEVSGEKKWKDAGPVDRPESIVVMLTRNVKGELDHDFKQQLTVTPDSNEKWTYTFEALPEFDEEGQAYTYTVKEKTEPAGYESSVEGYDIINLRVGIVNLSGTKTWKDNHGTDRPDSITVNLLRNNSVVDTKVVQLSDSADEWSYTFIEHSEFDENGIAYDYRVAEEDAAGYAAKFSGMDIINTRSEKKTVEITKGWLDNNSKDRPKSIKVDLYQNDQFFKTVKVKASEGWIYEFKDLEAYDENGKGYTYSIKEQAIKGYESMINGFNLTNLRVGETDVHVIKNWVNDQKENRPMSIEVDLLQNGKVLKTVTLSATDGWAYTFSKLAKYDQEGKAYKYTIQEKPVKGYETSLEETDTGFKLTNTYVTAEILVKPDKPGEPGKTEKSDLPKTGETNNTGLYLMGGLFILVGLVLGKKRIEE